MITDHKWRPPMVGTREDRRTPWAERACLFMNCARPAAEHVQVVNPIRTARRRKVVA